MKAAEFLSEDMPGDAKPYESTNATGHLRLSPYSNDWDAPADFKDVDSILTQIDRLYEQGKYSISNIPLDKVLATQYWIDDENIGAGDPVFKDLEDYPVAARLSDGYYHIIDGHHRTDAAAARHDKNIKVYLFIIS